MAIENFKRIIDSAVNADIFDQEDSFEEEEEKFHLRGSDGVEASGSGTCRYSACSNIGGYCSCYQGCYDDGPERGACRGFMIPWKCTCYGEGSDCKDDISGEPDDKNCCATNADGYPLVCCNLSAQGPTCLPSHEC